MYCWLSGAETSPPPRLGHKGLEDGKEDAAVFGDSAFFADFFGFYADEGVVGEGREGVI
jgi:hypothetical protein